MLFTVTNDNDCVKVGIQFRNTVPMVTRIVIREISTHTPNFSSWAGYSICNVAPHTFWTKSTNFKAAARILGLQYVTHVQPRWRFDQRNE